MAWGCHGLVTKSNAPSLMPSTARSMLPHAVMSMTGTSDASTLNRCSSSSPSCPEVNETEKFISITTRSGRETRSDSSASSGDAAIAVW